MEWQNFHLKNLIWICDVVLEPCPSEEHRIFSTMTARRTSAIVFGRSLMVFVTPRKHRIAISCLRSAWKLAPVPNWTRKRSRTVPSASWTFQFYVCLCNTDNQIETKTRLEMYLFGLESILVPTELIIWTISRDDSSRTAHPNHSFQHLRITFGPQRATYYYLGGLGFESCGDNSVKTWSYNYYCVTLID